MDLFSDIGASELLLVGIVYVLLFGNEVMRELRQLFNEVKAW